MNTLYCPWLIFCILAELMGGEVAGVVAGILVGVLSGIVVGVMVGPVSAVTVQAIAGAQQ